MRDPDSPDVGARKLADRWKAAQLRQLGPDLRRLERPDQRDRVALVREPEPSGPGSPGDCRRSRPPASGRSARPPPRCRATRCPDHRNAELLAGTGDALDRLHELPGDLRPLGVAEVQAVGEPEWLGAGAGDVRGALYTALGGAATGSRRRAGRFRRRARSPTPSGRTSTAASASSGRRTVRDCTSWSYCSNTQSCEAFTAHQRQQRLGRRSPRSRVRRRVQPGRGGACSRWYRGESSTSRLTGTSATARRDAAPKALAVGDLADRRAAPPSARTRRARADALGPGHARIRSCDSETMISNGSMSGSRSGIAQVERHPDAALAGHLGRGRGEPGRAQVLQRDQQLALEQLEGALDQLLAAERVADLDRRPLGLVALASSALASTEAPPMPSRPVNAPSSTTTLPGTAAALRISRSCGAARGTSR